MKTPGEWCSKLNFLSKTLKINRIEEIQKEAYNEAIEDCKSMVYGFPNGIQIMKELEKLKYELKTQS